MTTESSGWGRVDRVSLAVCAGGAVLSGILWDRLPERIPVHFDLWGMPDGFAPRAIGAFALPVVGLFLVALLRVAPRRFEPSWRERADRSPMAEVGLLTSLLLTGLHSACLWSALHPGASAARPLGLCLALFWLATSLLLPRVRRNPLVGIRTSWSMASDENWARTHRFAGLLGTAGGVVALVGALVGYFPVVVFAVLGSALPSVVYSYLLSRRDREREPDGP